MRRLALALLLAVPLAANAQYPAPYGYPPPPPPPPMRMAPYGYPPPPPPVYVAPQPPPLSPFYFNLGVGYGIQSWYAPLAYASVGGLAYHVEAGARIMPQLLLGFDLSGLTAFGSAPYGDNADVTVLNYDAVATLFPFVRGFFLRGGAGLSTLTWTPAYAVGVSYLGTNLLLGAGWAFPLAPPLHLTLGVDWSHQFFGTPDVSGLSTWMMRIGFGIY
jgi:hypothetical protein